MMSTANNTTTTTSSTAASIAPVSVTERATLAHKDATIVERTEAVAAVPARGVVQAEARVETHAGDHFAEATQQKAAAAEAAHAKADAHLEHENARPGAHAKGIFSGIGDKVSGAFEKRKEASALKKHELAAESEEQRARREEMEAKEAARLAALREAEAKAAVTNRSAIVSEFANGREIVAVAEVPARGATFGSGVAESRADEHLLRAARERELALEAEAAKAAAEAKLATAHPAGEAKAAVGGLGTKIHAKIHETKEAISAKLHDRKAAKEEKKGEAELERDMALAREKAKAAAEAEAAREDHNARARIIDEKTTTTVSTATTRA